MNSSGKRYQHGFAHSPYCRFNSVVLAPCMSWLISFARTAWSGQERESSENYKMKKSCSLWDSSPGPSACEVKALPLSYGGLNVCRVNKSSPGFNCAIFKKFTCSTW